MPGPESVTLKMTGVRSCGAQAYGGILRRKSDGIRQQIIQHLHHAAFVAHEAPNVGIDVDLEFDAVGRKPVWMPSAAASMVLRMSTEPRLSDIAPASNGGEIEDVVMIASSALVRSGDVAEIFGLLRIQRPVTGPPRKWAKR